MDGTDKADRIAQRALTAGTPRFRPQRNAAGKPMDPEQADPYGAVRVDIGFMVCAAVAAALTGAQGAILLVHGRDTALQSLVACAGALLFLVASMLSLRSDHRALRHDRQADQAEIARWQAHGSRGRPQRLSHHVRSHTPVFNGEGARMSDYDSMKAGRARAYVLIVAAVCVLIGVGVMAATGEIEFTTDLDVIEAKQLYTFGIGYAALAVVVCVLCIASATAGLGAINRRIAFERGLPAPEPDERFARIEARLKQRNRSRRSDRSG